MCFLIVDGINYFNDSFDNWDYFAKSWKEVLVHGQRLPQWANFSVNDNEYNDGYSSW
jgi:hypothetical protein